MDPSTNLFGVPVAPCCSGDGGGDLLPLWLALIVLFAGHIVLREFKKRKGRPELKRLKNFALVVAVAATAAAVFALKSHRGPPEPLPAAAGEAVTAAVAVPRPRLVDLGADKCVSCKMMAPVLDEMRTACAGQLQVDFIDVWQDPEAGERHGVRIIPTQIFFDAEGRELFRHEGFFAKDDMLAKWKELGFEFRCPPPAN